MNNYAQDQYMKTQVLTADRGKLVVILYEGAIKFLKFSQDGIAKNNAEERNNNLVQALQIIDELRTTLNISEGKEIARSLNALYLFMSKHLAAANIQNSSRMIKEVINMLATLNEAWTEIAAKPETGRPLQGIGSQAA